MKVGKNLVSEDEGRWLVEIWEYDLGKTPMYSTFDSYKDKSEAIRVAKLVNKDNAYRMNRFHAVD